MKRKNLTRNALFTSIISLLLCVSMLVGTTFAWFTDEVVTGMNTIAAGNLDIELLADGTKVDSNTMLFDDVKLWEPGVVVYENLQIANVGTLALKYQMSLNFGGENDLNGHKLSEVLKVAIIDKVADGTSRETVLAAAKAVGGTLSAFTMTGELEANTSTDEKAVVIFWDPNENSVDNLYNANNGKPTSDGEPLHIKFGVNLQATQKMSEEDSFGNDYDKPASLPVEVATLEELKEAFKEGGNVVLTENITFDNMIKIEDGVEVYLNMNGKTVTFDRNNDFKPGNPMLYPLTGSKLIITGNGTFDLEDNFDAALVYPAGEVIIENGTFIRDRVPEGTSPDNVQTLFMGVKSKGASVVIKGGYFDGGYYDKNADLPFSETAEDEANRGQAKDKNLYRTAIKNNTSLLLNLSWSSEAGTQDFRVYGGTFVGANPAWGDEGCAMPITPDYLRPWSYYQGTFLAGQQVYDDRIELPSGCSITESTTGDGRPVFTVNYN